MNPAGINDKTMMSPSSASLAQGTDYENLHMGQHGGAVDLAGAPVGTTGMLDSSLRGAAHLSPLDASTTAAQGMSDQAGGARRRGSRRKSKRNSRRSSRRNRRGSRRKQRGGFNHAMRPADYGASTHLLSPTAEAHAVSKMNPEWLSIAPNPMALAPKA